MNCSSIKKPKNSNGRRRLNLWRQYPYCHYCDKELKWRETSLEHLYSRVKNGKYKGKREKKHNEVETYTVLSCKMCNQEQQLKEHAEMPRWKIWRKSRAFPSFFKKQLTMWERFVILWYQFNLDYKPERV